MGQVSVFYSKVAGVSHKNPDGTSRQRILAKLRANESLTLQTEPENKHDPNAVKVCRSDGSQVGYLGGHICREVSSRVNKGWRYSAFVKEVTGSGQKTRGVNILLVGASPDTSNAEAQREVNAFTRQGGQSSVGSAAPARRVGCLILLGAVLFVAILIVMGLSR